jgi:hypothetical protein
MAHRSSIGRKSRLGRWSMLQLRAPWYVARGGARSARCTPCVEAVGGPLTCYCTFAGILYRMGDSRVPRGAGVLVVRLDERLHSGSLLRGDLRNCEHAHGKLSCSCRVVQRAVHVWCVANERDSYRDTDRALRDTTGCVRQPYPLRGGQRNHQPVS